MKKIGFIDLYIDEWHANNFPAWIRSAKRAAEFEIAMAWEERPAEGGKPLAQWCEQMNVAAARSLEQVVEECDALVVFAPSNPEVHERLAQLPLQSGKPVYVDKPFTTDRASAERMFALARKNGTPLMSSSALRYGDEIIQAKAEALAGVKPYFVGTRGGGRVFSEYVIHQLEMITMLLGTGAKRVMQCGVEGAEHMLIDYADGRRATLTLNASLPFAAAVCAEGQTLVLDKMSNIFPNLVDAVLEFFATGKSAIDDEETLEIAGLMDASVRALGQRDQWLVL